MYMYMCMYIYIYIYIYIACIYTLNIYYNLIVYI